MTNLTPERSALDVRRTLELVLSAPGLIGQYVLPDGSRRPAVFVVGRAQVPSTYKVQGVELILQDSPRVSERPCIGPVMLTHEWEGRLTAWDTKQNLFDHQRLLMRAFGSSISLEHTTRTDITYEQVTFRLRDDVQYTRLIRS